MPITLTEYPILLKFTCIVEKSTGKPMNPNIVEAPVRQEGENEQVVPKKLPKGVVLGKDGKPCRSCTSVASWMAMARQETANPGATSKAIDTPAATSSGFSTTTLPSDCPPDVEALGRASWTLLHSITAMYPSRPSLAQQSDAASFLSSFSRLYPCWVCAEDFQTYMKENRPRVSSREEFGRWMCEAHNAVSDKLGKNKFDCTKWEERWRIGWKDGRCD